ncbi:6-phosphogluconolactonase [Gammaproteobacteria bacterium]|nr:6-phosphogluconolactonase [Gammaproteobacteria bacterium]
MISKNIVKILKQSLAKEGHASLLVCGGSSPLKIFHELNQAKLDWKNITISLIDDRIVNNDHPDSNEFLVKSHLLKNLAADAKFISLNNDHELLLKDRKRFDVAIIGMGPDGHFASLFPSMISTTNYLDHFADPAIILTDLIGIPEYMRTSMNLSMILKTENIFVVIPNEDKLNILEDAKSNKQLPMFYLLNQKIRPINILKVF